MNLDEPSRLHTRRHAGEQERPAQILFPFDDIDWIRRKRVTAARAGVVLLLAGLYLASALPAKADPGFIEAIFREQMKWFVGPGVLYALTVGLVTDHLVARLGPLLAMVIHYGVMTVFFAGIVAVGAREGDIAYADIPTLIGWGVLPFLYSFYVLLAYIFAWVIPGSFPRSVGHVRAVARAVAHPIRTRRRFMDGTPERPAVWPSIQARTDWL